MTGVKQPRNDENTPVSSGNTVLEFRDGLKCRRKTHHVSEDEIQVLRDKRAANDARVAEEQKETLQAKAEAENCRLRARAVQLRLYYIFYRNVI